MIGVVDQTTRVGVRPGGVAKSSQAEVRSAVTHAAIPLSVGGRAHERTTVRF
jgi:hypothetical protein